MKIETEDWLLNNDLILQMKIYWILLDLVADHKVHRFSYF